jgi:hypothetical protein
VKWCMAMKSQAQPRVGPLGSDRCYSLVERLIASIGEEKRRISVQKCHSSGVRLEKL